MVSNSDSDVRSGIFFNIDDYESQVDDKSLLTALEANLSSLIEHDKALYMSGFVNGGLTANFEYYYSDHFQYQFHGIESIEQNLPYGNVHITVIGKRLDTAASTAVDVKMMYAFRQNDQGKWMIHTID